MTRTTVVGLFRDSTEAQAAIHDLVNSGFLREDVSLVIQQGAAALTAEHGADTTESAPATTKGAAIGGTAGALLGLVALAVPGIGPVLALGPLAAALTGAGIGAATGGMIGALADMGVPEHESQYYEDAIHKGGSLVVVRASSDIAERAQDILDRHGALDVNDSVRQHETPVGDLHRTETANLGDEGGSTQWSHTALTASEKRFSTRAYPDNRREQS